MGNKLKITESQFNRIKHRLLETEDVNHTLDSVKVGDVLKFKTSAGSDYTITVQHVDQNGNEILGDNHGNKIYLNFNSYDEQSKKLNYKQLDKTTQKYIDKTVDVKELDIERNGKIVDIRDKNTEPTSQTPKPTPAPTSQKDDISQPVDLDPNNTKEKEILSKDEKTDDILKTYYKEIMNDPNLKQAFYKAPSFWNYFTSALKGKPAKGSGIYPTLKLVNTYKNNEIDKIFPGFTDKQNQRAAFELKTPISIPYRVKKTNESKNLNVNSGSAVVQQYKLGQGNTKVLIDIPSGFKIVIKNKTPNTKDTYTCDFYVELDNVTKDTYKQENVVVLFGKSPGYEPEKRNR